MSSKSDKYKKNEDEETFLSRFNSSLSELEREYTDAQKPSDQPVLFICGAPRSGTTLISQALASTGVFNYIDNFVARFWRAPFVGFYLEKITRLRKISSHTRSSFESEFGRTSGILEPHEFTYFWEFWLKPDTSHHILPASHISQIDKRGLIKEINAMLNIYEKPLFFKNVWFLSNPQLAHALFKNIFIIFITRELIHNASSILDARIEYNGYESEWFSVRIPDYEKLLPKPVETQIIEQILNINRIILEQSKSFPDKVIRISYEDLCEKPVEVLLQIVNTIGIDNKHSQRIKEIFPADFSFASRNHNSTHLRRFGKFLHKF